MQMYMVPISTVAMARPQNPPAARPKFQPKNSPEMTAPTPKPQRDTQLAFLCNERFSRYSVSTFSYRMNPEAGASDSLLGMVIAVVGSIGLSCCEDHIEPR